MNYSNALPSEVRKLIRNGEITGKNLRNVQRLCPGKPLHFAKTAGI